MKKARRSTSRFSKTAGMARGAVRALGVTLGAAGIVYALKKAIQAFVAFEKQLAMVSTMLDEGTMKHMKAYREGLEQLSVELGESTTTLARGLYDILSAAIAPAKAMKVLEVAARAAKGGLTDTAIAADAITTILNSYRLSADRAADVSDFLFTVVKRGKTTFAELALPIGKAASLAAVAGMKLEEFGAVIATITRGGIRVEESMTGVNAIIRSFIAPTTEARVAAAKLGIDLSSLTLTAVGLTGVLGQLEGVSPEVLAQIFPNVRALKSIAVLVKNIDTLKTDLVLMKDRTGAANKAFEKMADTQATAWARAGQQVKALSRDIGEMLQLGPRVEKMARLMRSAFQPIDLGAAADPYAGQTPYDDTAATIRLINQQAAERARDRARTAAQAAVSLPTYTATANLEKKAMAARAQATLDASKLVQLDNLRLSMLDQAARFHRTERELLTEKVAILGATNQEMESILKLHDRIADAEKAMASGRAMKAFATGVRASLKTSAQHLEDFRQQLKSAVAAGLLTGADALTALAARAKELKTPMAADRGPGEFRAIRSAFMDIGGMGGGKSAELSEAERQTALMREQNRLIEERLGVGLN